MKYLITAIMTAALLTGCATQKEPETTLVPISVPCETETPNKPTLRFSPPYEDIFEAVRDLLGDRAASEAYEIELEAALKSCK